MPSTVALGEPNIPSKYVTWGDAQKFTSRGRTFSCNGQEHQIVLKKQRHFSTPEFIGRVCLASCAVIFTLGVALVSKTIRDCFTKRYVNMRFSIPTESFQKLKEAPLPDQVQAKLQTLDIFYRSYFKATNNEQAIVEVVHNCLDACSTIQDLNAIYGFINCNKLHSPDTSAKMSKVLNKVVDACSSVKNLHDIAHFILLCDKNLPIVTEAIEKKVAACYIRFSNVKGFHLHIQHFAKHIFPQLNQFEKRQALAVCGAFFDALIFGELDKSDTLTQATSHILETPDFALPNAREMATYYAMQHQKEFTKQEIECSVRLIIGASTPFASVFWVYVQLAVDYVVANSASFTLEEKAQALFCHFDMRGEVKEAILALAKAVIQEKAKQKFSKADLFVIGKVQQHIDKTLFLDYINASNDIDDIMALYHKITAPTDALRFAAIRKLLAQPELAANHVSFVDQVLFGSVDAFSEAEKAMAAARILHHTDLPWTKKIGAAKFVFEHRKSFSKELIEKALFVGMQDAGMAEKILLDGVACCKNLEALAKLLSEAQRLITYQVRLAASKRLLDIFDKNSSTFMEQLITAYDLVHFMFSHQSHYSHDELLRAAKIVLERNDVLSAQVKLRQAVCAAMRLIDTYVQRHPEAFTVAEFQKIKRIVIAARETSWAWC